MLNDNKDRLQLLYHDSIFSTRADAQDYINDFFRPESLIAEPACVFYGDKRNPNVLLAIGTGNRKVFTIDVKEFSEILEELDVKVNTNEDNIISLKDLNKNLIETIGLKFDENKKTDQISYVPDRKDVLLSDAKSIADAISILSKVVQDLSFNVEDSKSIRLVKKENGIVKAHVKVSESGADDDVNFNDNIIGIKNDGIFASVWLDYDPDKQELIFTTSGTRDSKFKDDAYKKVIKLNGLVTPKISESDNNILEIQDGAMLVKGTANNIKYKNTTVFNAINDLQKEVEKVKDYETEKFDFISESGNEPVELHAHKNTDGVTKISTHLKLASNDNAIEINDKGELYVPLVAVSGDVGAVYDYAQKIKEELSTEVINRKEADSEIKTQIKELGYALSTEQTRAENAETALEKSIQTVVDTVNSNNDTVKELQSNLQAEISRATDAENTINSTITNEVHKLEIVDTELSARITAVEKGVSDNTTNIEHVTDKLSNVNEELKTVKEEYTTTFGRIEERLNNEITSRETADKVLDDKIIAQTQIITNADAKITNVESTLNTTIADYTTKFGVIETNLSNETTNRINSDTELANKIADLKSVVDSNAVSTDSNLSSVKDELVTRIATEENRAKEAENKNSDAITHLNTELNTKVSNALVEAKAYTDSLIPSDYTALTYQVQNNTDNISAINVTLANVNESLLEKVSSVELVKVEGNNATYQLLVDGKPNGTIDIMMDNILVDSSFDPGTKILTLEFKVENGQTKQVNVNLESLVDVYKAGNGLKLDPETNTFSLMYNEVAGEGYLKIDESGICVVGINAELNKKANVESVYTKDEINRDFVSNASLTETLNSYITNDTLANGVARDLNDLTVQVEKNTELVEKFNGNELVEGSILNIKKSLETDFNNKINDEISQRSSEVNALTLELNQKANSSDVYTKSEADGLFLKEAQDISNLATKLELTAVESKTDANTSKITQLENAIETNKFNTGNSQTINLSIEHNADSANTLKGDVILDSNGSNIIRKTENGLYAKASLTYDSTGDSIVFDNGIDTPISVTLNKFNGINDAYYDKDNQEIIFEVSTSDGVKLIKVDARDFFQTLKADNTDDDPIHVTITEAANGGYVISANLVYSHVDGNLITQNNSGIYASDNAKDHYCLDDTGAKATVQQVLTNLFKEVATITTLSNKVDDLGSNLNEVKASIANNNDKISTIETAITNVRNDIITTNTTVASQSIDIATLRSQISTLENEKNELQTKYDALSDTVEQLLARIEQLENDEPNVEKYDKVIGDVDNYNKPAMTERLDEIENVIDNLIDFETY